MIQEHNSNSNTAAFFDLDLTVTSCDTFRTFIYIQYFKKPLNYRLIPFLIWAALSRKLRFISLQEFKEKVLVFLKNKSEKYTKKLGKEYFENIAKYYVREEIKNRINWHKRKGHLIFLITASPDIYISHFSTYLNCDGYECSKLLFQGGIFSGKLEGRDCIGEIKCSRVNDLTRKFNLNLKKSYAYSDHEADLPFLKMVGHPVAVKPTKKLKKRAMEKKWEIFL